MSAESLRDLTVEELRTKELDLREELFKLRFQRALRQTENTARLRHLRREIARVLTVCRERDSDTLRRGGAK